MCSCPHPPTTQQQHGEPTHRGGGVIFLAPVRVDVTGNDRNVDLRATCVPVVKDVAMMSIMTLR